MTAPGFDYLNFQARSLFPGLNPTLGLPFPEYFSSLEASRVAHETSLLEHSALTSHHHNHHLSPDSKLNFGGGGGAFDMKNLLMAQNHCQPSSNPGSGITCSSPYNLIGQCCPSLHPSAQISSLSLQSFASMAHSSNSTLGTASTSQSNCMIRPKMQSNQRLEERNKSNSDSPSPNSFRLSHPTPMSNNSSASSSPSSPVPTHSFNMPPHMLAGPAFYNLYGKCCQQWMHVIKVDIQYE